MFKHVNTLMGSIVSILLIIAGIYFLFFYHQKVIYIYHDKGVSEECLQHTLHYFKKQAGSKYQIKTINAEEIKQNQWPKHTALLVIPGGADIPYMQKLNGLGNQNIKTYVENGGTYLGICAGAYYASNYVEFDKGGKLEVLGNRELSFFPGKAIGPCLAEYVYKSNKGARAASIQLQHKVQVKDIHLFYNGGCYFEEADSYPNVSVLGWYQDKEAHKLPAIIKIQVGKGRAILSGVHFEYDPALLDKQDPHLQAIIPLIQTVPDINFILSCKKLC